MIETSGTLLAENLLVVLELGAIWTALRVRRAAKPYRWLIATGVLAGLATLTHENALVLLIPLGVAAYSALPPGRPGIRRLAAPAAVIVTAALTIAPWSVRNAIVLHSFVPVSDQAGETVFGTYNSVSASDPRLPYRWLWPSKLAPRYRLVREAPLYSEPAWENRLLRQSLRYIGSHPFSPLVVAFHNTVRMLDVGGSFAWRSAAAAISIPSGVARAAVVSFWLIGLLALLGAMTSYARAAPRWLWLAPLLLTVSVVFVRMETPRFREPIEPFVVMLAACALTAVAERVGEEAAAGAQLVRRSGVRAGRR
jgi:hypothetical protein